MKRPELYKKTCDILYDAYFNDTLQHGNQCGCAVGNLVAAGMGIKLKVLDNQVIPEYMHNHLYINDDKSIRNNGLWYNREEPGVDPSLVDEQIKSTGYSLEEIILIERAFENCDCGDDDELWMFNGLVAVIEALNEIHEVQEDNQTERFKRVYKTKVSV